MTLFKLIFIISCVVSLLGAKAQISDKRLCANEDCSEPISTARTLLKYAAAAQGMLSFGPNEVLTIYSKAAGKNMAVWGAELKGQRGYIPTNLIREEKVFKKDLKFLIDTELVNKEVPSDNPAPPIKVEPNKPDTVVVEGTTIYNSDIEVSSTLKEPLVEPTALPQDTVKVDSTANQEEQAQVDEPQKTVDSEGNTVNQNSSVPEPTSEQNAKPFSDDKSEKCDDDDMCVEDDSDSYLEWIEMDGDADDDNNLSTGDLSNSIAPEPEKPQSPPEDNANEPEKSEPETKKLPPVFEELLNVKTETETSNDTVVKLEYDEIVYSESAKLSQGENTEKTAGNTVVTENTDTKKESTEYVSTTSSFYKAAENIISESSKAAVENVTTEGNVNAEGLSSAVESSSTKQADTVNDEDAGLVANVTTEGLSSAVESSSANKADIVNNKDAGLAVTEKEPATNTVEGLGVIEKNPTDNTVEKLREHSGFYKPFGTGFYPRVVDLQSDNSAEQPIDNTEVKSETNDPLISTHQQPNSPDTHQQKQETSVPSSVPFNYQQPNSPDVHQQKPETSVPSSIFPNYQEPNSPETSVPLSLPPSYQQPNSPDIDQQKPETSVPSSIFPNYQQPSVDDEEISSDDLKTESSANPTTIIPDIPTVTDDEPSSTELPAVVEKAEETIVTSEIEEEVLVQEVRGYFSAFLNMFGGTDDNAKVEGEGEFVERNDDVLLSRTNDHANSCTMDPSGEFCAKEEKPVGAFTDSNAQKEESFLSTVDLHDLLKLLGVSGATIVVFLWGYIIIDKMRKEGPLIAKINNLEKTLLVTTKENQILTEKLNESDITSKDNTISNEIIEELKAELECSNGVRAGLEEQIQSLEKELENSTEVGLELNRMLSEILSSQNGSDALMSNIEQLQNKLVEQQSTINTINASLSEKETANHELQLELEINNKKVIDLQNELDKMVENLLKIEEKKEHSQNKFETQIYSLKQAANSVKQNCDVELNSLKNELGEAQRKLKETQRNLELKNNEYNLLKDNVKTIGSDNDIQSLLDANSIKAEMQQLQQEKVNLTEHLQQHQQLISNFESQVANMGQDLKVYREKYEEADREKVQVITKLDVLNTYFKEKEAELQKEIAKHESMWMERKGEASSTIGRIKFMQEEIQNFKAQNESLKQEIISQEVELKSQISVLEKKAHESWMAARQAERKLEDVKQEAATLRNRLTLRERSLNEDKSQNRLQSPLESNGDHPLSPLHMNVESPASPPLLYGARDHLTTSPPLPGLPPFLPPPPGVPFIPPPIPGIPPFMPPPPSMYPGDHRPPPLGRMSSPQMNSRYSPDSRQYLHYDRNSPSPTDDEYYGISHRGYSPYNGRDNRRDYGRNTHRSNNKKELQSGESK